MSSNLLHFLLEPLHCCEDRRATDCHVAAPIGPASLRGGVRVAMDHHHVLYRDTQRPSQNLCKGCLSTLSMWRRASVDHHMASVLDTDTCALIESNRHHSLGTYAAGLDIAGETDPHELAITRSTSVGLFCPQILIIR